MFEALRVVGTVYEDGFAEPRRRRIVHRITVYPEAARRLQKALGGDAFNALLTIVMNCEEDEASGLLRMSGGQLRLRKLLGWGEDRMKRVFRTLEAAGFTTSEQHRDAGGGRRYGQTYLIPHQRLCQEACEPLDGAHVTPDRSRVSASGFPGTGESRSGSAPGFPGTGSQGPGNPEAEVKLAGQTASGFPGSGEPGPLHDDDGNNSSSSSWDEPPAAQRGPARRSKAAEQPLGALVAGMFDGVDRKISSDTKTPQPGVVGTPQKRARLRAEATFAEVTAVLLELGFTDAERFARSYWGKDLIGWVNHVVSRPGAVKRPGAYLRSVLASGKPAPAEDPAPAPDGPARQDPPPAPEPPQVDAPGPTRRRPEPVPEPVGEVPPPVRPDDVRAVLDSLPQDIADRVTEEVRGRLKDFGDWLELENPSALQQRLVYHQQRDVLWEFGLLDEDPPAAGAGSKRRD